jgi:hypothetical protein
MSARSELIREEIRTLTLAYFFAYGWVPYPLGPTDGDRAELTPPLPTDPLTLAPLAVQYQLADSIARAVAEAIDPYL